MAPVGYAEKDRSRVFLEATAPGSAGRRWPNLSGEPGTSGNSYSKCWTANLWVELCRYLQFLSRQTVVGTL